MERLVLSCLPLVVVVFEEGRPGWLHYMHISIIIHELNFTPNRLIAYLEARFAIATRKHLATSVSAFHQWLEFVPEE